MTFEPMAEPDTVIIKSDFQNRAVLKVSITFDKYIYIFVK
jgi:hypothetical protein